MLSTLLIGKRNSGQSNCMHRLNHQDSTFICCFIDLLVSVSNLEFKLCTNIHHPRFDCGLNIRSSIGLDWIEDCTWIDRLLFKTFLPQLISNEIKWRRKKNDEFLFTLFNVCSPKNQCWILQSTVKRQLFFYSAHIIL